MTDFTHKIKNELHNLGADIVGFGSLEELPADVREGMPVGIIIAVKYPKEVILDIKELPTQEYRDWYDRLNERLDIIVTCGASLLFKMGYKATAKTCEQVGYDGEGDKHYTMLPHKTVATRAGIGWIGKCALLVTEDYGSAVRLSSILTDAPLNTASPINKSRCGDCMICTNACPGAAVSGIPWVVRLDRDDFFNPDKCSKTARERSKLGFGGDITICGKCIEVCPYTQKYINDKS